MKLTTRSSYGVRALIRLAIEHDGGEPVSIGHISREEGISNIYLEQIFNCLKNRGLVKSVRGPRGGYVLARDPSRVSVYEVVMALEGSISPARCISSGKGKENVCGKASRCASKEVWDEMGRQIKETLGRFSLRGLAERAMKITPGKNGRVYIYEKSLS